MRSFRLAIFLASAFVAPAAHSAACCGGGANFPSLILSDNFAQLGFSAAYSAVIGDAPATGKPVFRSDRDDEWVHTYTVDAATLVSDRWQVGASLPLARRSRSTDSASASEWGLADIAGTVGYEFLPEFSYSVWRPRGFAFLQLTAPTGGEIYTSTKLFAVDARGKGFYTLSLGAFLIKSHREWDASWRFALNHSLRRRFDAADGTQLEVRPGLDFISALSMGYSPKQSDWRLGLSLSPAYTAPTNVSLYRLVWTTTLDVTRLIDMNWVWGVAYNDQTLVGPASNTGLERGVVAFLRYKWSR